MAENVPAPSAGGVNVDALGEAVTQEVMARIKLDELAEAVTKEVMARLAESSGANPAATEPAETAQDGAEAAGGTSTPPTAEPPQEPVQAAQEAPKPKTARKTTKK
jgi:heme-binding NEAT domain protein